MLLSQSERFFTNLPNYEAFSEVKSLIKEQLMFFFSE